MAAVSRLQVLCVVVLVLRAGRVLRGVAQAVESKPRHTGVPTPMQSPAPASRGPQKGGTVFRSLSLFFNFFGSGGYALFCRFFRLPVQAFPYNGMAEF